MQPFKSSHHITVFYTVKTVIRGFAANIFIIILQLRFQISKIAIGALMESGK
jgi:hypothetical protein